MSSNAQKNSLAGSLHRGISIVEFVGCLAALGGGIVLGSIYLGVDVKAMAVGILEKADIDVPAILVTDGSTADTPQVESQPAEDAAETDSNAQPISDPEALATAAADQLADDAPEPLDAATTEPSKVLTKAEQIEATKACWQGLSKAMKQESINRSQSIRDPGELQLFDYLLHRKEGHAQSVEAIESLDLEGVDPRLVTHVQQVLTWHRAGANLFERAAQLLTDAPAGKLSGPFAQSWQSASTQHRMEEQLILNKHKAVASYLEHTQKSADTSTAND